jgi:hypothetical protein
VDENGEQYEDDDGPATGERNEERHKVLASRTMLLYVEANNFVAIGFLFPTNQRPTSSENAVRPIL